MAADPRFLIPVDALLGKQWGWLKELRSFYALLAKGTQIVFLAPSFGLASLHVVADFYFCFLAPT